MTRDDVRKAFPDATDDQIDGLLNIHSGDIGRARRDEAQKTKDGLQPELERLKGVEKERDDDKRARMTLEEQVQAAKTEAESAKREYTIQKNRLAVEKLLVGAGMAEDEYADLLDTLVTEDAKSSAKAANHVIGIVKAKTEAAEKALREKLLTGTPKPPDGSAAGGMSKKDFLSLPTDKQLAYMADNPNWQQDLT